LKLGPTEALELPDLRPSKMGNETSLGLICFLCAFLGAMLNLPAFLMLQATPTPLLVCWRYLGLLLLLLPRLVVDVVSTASTILETLRNQLPNVVCLAGLQIIYIYMVYFAVRHTFIAHTLLLCSLAATFSATWKIIRGSDYTRIEYLGIAVNIFGAYLCCCDGGPLPRKSRL
jgi:hypothetical protein